MKKTLSISVLACALALTFAVPALAHDRQACRQDPVCQEPHLCGENCSYLDEDGDGICDHRQDCQAYSSAENNDQPDCPYREQCSGGGHRRGHHSSSGYGRHCRR